MGHFVVKAKTLPTVSTGLLHAATILLNELHVQRGAGRRADELYDIIVRHIKNREFDVLSPVEEIEHVDAALTAIDALFSTVIPDIGIEDRSFTVFPRCI